MILAEEVEYGSLGRSNIGGWHSPLDFLRRPEPAVAGLTTWVTGLLVVFPEPPLYHWFHPYAGLPARIAVRAVDESSAEAVAAARS